MRRPIIKIGGEIGFLFKRVFEWLERLEKQRTPGMRTSYTVKGVVQTPIGKTKKSSSNSSAPVWL